MEEAFYMTLKKLEGKFSVAMVSEYEPGRIYFARNGTPLIIARSVDEKEGPESFISSDLNGIAAIAKYFYYLNDKEWGYFNSKEYSLFDWEKNPQKD